MADTERPPSKTVAELSQKRPVILTPKWEAVIERYKKRKSEPRYRPSIKEVIELVSEMHSAHVVYADIASCFGVSKTRIFQFCKLRRLNPNLWDMADWRLPHEKRLSWAEMIDLAKHPPKEQEKLAAEILSHRAKRPAKGTPEVQPPVEGEPTEVPKKAVPRTGPPLTTPHNLKQKLVPEVWEMYVRGKLEQKVAIKIAKLGPQLQEKQARLFVRGEISFDEI